MYMDLERIEFVMTYACTGKCKHCSLGDKLKSEGRHIDYSKMKGAIKALSGQYNIESIMCFGWEPLLFHKDVGEIIKEANIGGIPKRQIITNGYFSNEVQKISDVVNSLEKSGVTNILLSVDAFHQETIPLELVLEFAEKVKKAKLIDIKLHPAWVVDVNEDNEWNNKTREILIKFEHLNIPISKGNVIFPHGNAAKYLAEYYDKNTVDMDFYCGQGKYTPKLDDVDTISIMPNGDVNICCFKIGNVYEEDIINIIEKYNPYENEVTAILIKEGIRGLIEFGVKHGIEVDMTKFTSACSVCRYIIERLALN